MKLDPNWQPSPTAVARGRGTGRTTKMLCQAIGLAREPQTIITLWPSIYTADWGFEYGQTIVESTVGFCLAHTKPWRRIDFGYSAIYFLDLQKDPGQWLVGGIDNLSILVDNSVDDLAPMDRNYYAWMDAIKYVQSLSESGQTIHQLRLALMMSRR